jgi:hypothetical protein
MLPIGVIILAQDISLGLQLKASSGIMSLMQDARIEITHGEIHSGFSFHCWNGYTVSVQKGNIAGVNMASEETSEVAIMYNDRFCIIPHDCAGHVPDGHIPRILDAVQEADWDEVRHWLGLEYIDEPPYTPDAYDYKEAMDKQHA